MAKKPAFGPYQAQVVRVVDGDTVKLDVAIWPGVTQQINLRLSGVNTPETRGKDVTDCEKRAAQEATTFTQRWLRGVATVTVTDVKLGKYAGRALGQIEAPGKGDLAKALISSGHGRPYHGGKRQPWC